MPSQVRRILTDWTYDGIVSQEREVWFPVELSQLLLHIDLRNVYTQRGIPTTPSEADAQAVIKEEPTVVREPIKQEPIVEPDPIYVTKVTDDTPVDTGYTTPTPSKSTIDLEVGSDGGAYVSEGIDYEAAPVPAGTVVEYDVGVSTAPTTDSTLSRTVVPPEYEESRYYTPPPPEKTDVVIEETVSTGSSIMTPEPVPDSPDSTRIDYTESQTVDMDMAITPENVDTGVTSYHEEVPVISTSTETGIDASSGIEQVQYDTSEPVLIDETIEIADKQLTAPEAEIIVNEPTPVTSNAYDIVDDTSVQPIGTPPPSDPTIDTDIGDVYIPDPEIAPSEPEVSPVYVEPTVQSVEVTAASIVESPTIITEGTTTTADQDIATTLTDQPAEGAELATDSKISTVSPTTKTIIGETDDYVSRDYYTLEGGQYVPVIDMTFYLDGTVIAKKSYDFAPYRIEESVLVDLPSSAIAGKHLLRVAMTTNYAIYKGDIRIEYDLPAATTWQSDRPPGEVPTPPEIPNPIKAVGDWFNNLGAMVQDFFKLPTG